MWGNLSGTGSAGVDRSFWAVAAETVRDWPWSTIAAFMAVGMALWVANSDSRQRRRQLRQGAILDINTASNEWMIAVGEYCNHAQRYNTTLPVPNFLGVQSPWHLEWLSPVSTATTRMDRAIKAAHMSCTDSVEVQGELTRLGLVLVSFLQLISGPYPDDPEAKRERLGQLPAAIIPISDAFRNSSESLIEQGFDRYSFRKTLWYRLRRKFAKPITVE